jgi:ribonuclease BN (tRNA processing enzyme)
MSDTLDLTFLGTGGAFCDFRDNYHNNAMIKTPAGYILIDCGATAVQSLKELGIPVWEVAGVIVTHCHGDHIAGLEQLVWERFYTGPAGPGWLQTRIWSTEAINKQVRAALDPCIRDYTDLDGIHHDGCDRLTHFVNVQRGVQNSPGPGIEIAGLQFRFKFAQHVGAKDCISVSCRRPVEGLSLPERMGRDPHGFWYSSDKTFQEQDIRQHAKYNAVLFHEVTFSPHYPGTVHTHYEELLTLAPGIRSKIVLMHHTKVPDGIDVVADGFKAAANKHSTWQVPL